MSQLVFVHGFNVMDGGADTTGKLAERLGHLGEPCQFRYGWLGLLGVRLFVGRFARMLAGMVTHGAVGIGHSNGCLILHQAARNGAPFRHLILINPALDADIAFPMSVERIDVLHNSDDAVVSAGALLPFHDWGDMGRHGALWPDRRVRNFDTRMLFGVSGHSAVFGDDAVDGLAAFVSVLIKGIR
jgi:hypothetical protein